MIRKAVDFLHAEPLYKNSIYLMMSNLILMGTGFFFWIVAARLYSSEKVGIATTIYSLMVLISGLSMIGLNSGLIRYIPKSKYPSEKISTSLTITISITIAIALIVLTFIHRISPTISFLSSSIFYSVTFIAAAITTTVNSLLDSTFIAFRKAAHALIKNTIFGFAKLILPIFFVSLGAYGIFLSIPAGLAVGIGYGVFILIYKQKIVLKPILHMESIKIVARYAVGSYVSSLAINLPIYFLPILITNNISPKATAYYYMANTISQVINMIPIVVSQNLLVEGAHNEEEVRKHVFKALKLILLFILPMIFIIFFFGQYILLAFGKNYSNGGIELLKILSVGGIVVAVNSVFNAIYAIKKLVKWMVLISCINAFLTIVLSYVLMRFGLNGIGFAIILTQCIVAFLYSVILAFLRK